MTSTLLLRVLFRLLSDRASGCAQDIFSSAPIELEIPSAAWRGAVVARPAPFVTGAFGELLVAIENSPALFARSRADGDPSAEGCDSPPAEASELVRGAFCRFWRGGVLVAEGSIAEIISRP